MPKFYSFPTSCAVQVLGNFGSGDWPKESLDQPRLLTIAVAYDNGMTADGTAAQLKKLGFKKLGTFNRAHTSEHGGLSLWIAGGEFEGTKPEKQKKLKEGEDAKT